MEALEAKKTHIFPNASFTVDVRYVPRKIIGTGAYGYVCAADDNLTGKKVRSGGVYLGGGAL